MNNKYLEKIAEIGEELQLRSKYNRRRKRKSEDHSSEFFHAAEAQHKIRKLGKRFRTR